MRLNAQEQTQHEQTENGAAIAHSVPQPIIERRVVNAFTRATDALTSVLPFRSGKLKSGTRISPLAVVDPRATIGEGCEIGPFCIVGPDVSLGSGNKLLSHVVLTGHTTIGRDNVFHPHSVVGGIPQDKKYDGEMTALEIGDRNQIRENCTLHTGTEYGSHINGGGVTRVGSDNLLMVNCHVGHDSQVGDFNILANNVMLAGHTVLGNHIVINGAVGVTAFVTIGDFAYVGAFTRVHHDVPPFVKLNFDGSIRALNSVGLKRAGYGDDQIKALECAVRLLFNGRLAQSVALMELEAGNGRVTSDVKQMLDFLRRRDRGKHGRFLESLR